MLDLAELTEIIIYPIKSLAGIYLEQAIVKPTGLQDDRMMMLVDDNGLFISQRKYPQLALLGVEMEDGIVTVTQPDGNFITITNTSFDSQNIGVKVWKDDCSGIVAANATNLWFSQFLSISVRLIKYDKQNPRVTDPDYSKAGDIVSFADGFPLLVISQASLDDLNSRLNLPVTMRNFRPNIVISGCDAYSEDGWQKIRLGKVIFDAAKLCGRCIMTTVDPITGKRSLDHQPFKTLSQYREKNGQVNFGMNLIPRSEGKAKIGDSITAIE